MSIDQYVVKTPGRLPTGYGGSDSSMYHDGTITIFSDAASKYIHVQNTTYTYDTCG